MKKLWLDQAWKDYLYWQNHDPKILQRINDLIKSAERDPFHGMGKPEPLKRNRSGYWSRRITEKDRLIYRVHDGVIEITGCKEHYDD